MDKLRLKANWRQIRPCLYEPDVVLSLAKSFNALNWDRWTPRRFRTSPDCWQPGSTLGLGYNGDLFNGYGRARRWPDSPSAYFSSHHCHYLVDWSRALGARLDPDLRWLSLLGTKHSIAVGCLESPKGEYRLGRRRYKVCKVIDWLSEWFGDNTADESVRFVNSHRLLARPLQDEALWFWEVYPDLYMPIDNPQFARSFEDANLATKRTAWERFGNV